MKLWRTTGVLAAVLAVTGVVWTSSAAASISPTLTLDQSAGTQAAASQDLGMTIAFAPSGTDTANNLTIQLPPGLIANANVDNGACITTPAPTSTSTTPPAACQVGTGTASATADIVGQILDLPITLTLDYYLVAPPAPGDLAGLYVTANNALTGTLSLGTGDVFLRPSGDPAGVGLTIALALPQTPDGIPTSVKTITSTFDGLRYPSTCPSSPEMVNISATSYGAPSTPETASAPLTVSGCAAAGYDPTFSVTAAKDTGDNQVTLTADINQPNAISQLASQSTALTFPTSVLAPNLSVAGALCANVSSGNCTPIGSATAVSAVYPNALTGKAYLTGGPGGLSITLVFPSPFPLTLTGAVNLVTNTTTFTGLPDIPLTSLQVTLDGGADGAFATTCQTASGTASADLVAQGGSPSKSLTDPFTVSGWVACHGAPPGSGAGGSGGGGSAAGGGSGATTTGSGGAGSGNGGSGAGSGSSAKAGRPRLSAGVISGLTSAKPAARFTVTQGQGAGRLAVLTVGVTGGLTFHQRKLHGKSTVDGVSLTGAKIKSLKLSHGKLVITLAKTAGKVTVKLSPKALRESKRLRTQAVRRTLKRLRVNVTVKDATGKVTALNLQIKNLGLSKVQK